MKLALQDRISKSLSDIVRASDEAGGCVTSTCFE